MPPHRPGPLTVPTALRRLAAGLFALLAVLAFAPIASMAQDAAPEDVPTAAEADANEPTKRVVVRFLTEGDFPPFNFYDEDGSARRLQRRSRPRHLHGAEHRLRYQGAPLGRAAAGAAPRRSRRRHRRARGDAAVAGRGRLHRPLFPDAGALCRAARRRAGRDHAGGAGEQAHRRRQEHGARGVPARLLPLQRHPGRTRTPTSPATRSSRARSTTSSTTASASSSGCTARPRSAAAS